MSSSISELVRLWKEEDGARQNKNRTDEKGFSRARIPNISLHSIESIISELFGSCSVNISNFFDTDSPRSRSHELQKPSASTSQSNSTSPTAKSSSLSNGSSKKQMKRSQSVDYQRRRITRDVENQRRYRSMSRGYDHMTSIVPRSNIENTEISLFQEDDEVSTITARTLNELYIEEMQRISAEREKQIDNQSTLSLEIDDNTTALDDGTHISTKSSGTTEFTSIWRTKSNLSSSTNRNADNNRFGVNTDFTSGIYRQNQGNFEQINRGHFSTIDENDSLYLDEQEI